MTCSWYIIHSLFIYLSHWSFIITCSCLSCFSMNIIICLVHTGRQTTLYYIARSTQDAKPYSMKCPVPIGGQATLYEMPGPHRMPSHTLILSSQTHTIATNWDRNVNSQPVYTPTSRYSRRATIHTKNTKYTCGYYTNIQVWEGIILYTFLDFCVKNHQGISTLKFYKTAMHMIG